MPLKDKLNLPDYLRELERSMEQGIHRALARVKLPRREEVDALRERTARLARRVEALAQKRAGGRS